MAALMLAAAMAFTGCGLQGESKAEQEHQHAESANIYHIYYKNTQGDALAPRDYEAKSETFDEILREIATAFMNAPSAEVLSALPHGVEITSYTRGVDSLTVDLGTEYLAMSSTDQILLRSAIVKTLVQLPGVVKIYLTVEGQNLTNDAGVEFGALDENSFVTDLSHLLDGGEQLEGET